jgi:hypothetical protein
MRINVVSIGGCVFTILVSNLVCYHISPILLSEYSEVKIEF